MTIILCDNCEKEIEENKGLEILETKITGKLIICPECKSYYNEN